MSKVFIIGATGLVGSEFLKRADTSATFNEVVALSRRKLNKEVTSKVKSIIEPDSIKWTSIIRETPSPQVFFSGLATTKGAAGGFENQYKIDHDLNYELAKAAKEAGFSTYVLISSMGASEDSRFAYPKMKGELDQKVIDLKFPKTIIVRPGVLIGERDKSKGFFNNAAAAVGSLFHGTFLNQYTLRAITGAEIAKVVDKVISEPTAKENDVRILETGEIDRILKSLKD